MNGYTIDRKWMKREAKEAMRTHRPSTYLISFVFIVIGLVLNWLGRRLTLPELSAEEVMALMNDPTAIQGIAIRVMQETSVIARILSFAIDVMQIVIAGGFTLACLNIARRLEANVGTLFEMFGWFFRFLWLNILMGIFIFLWSLLFVIPGIIAAYRYSMAIFIFCDDPEKGALNCIRESKAITRGFKGQLFVLDLSFIGWSILSVIPFVGIYTEPYMATTKANFYRALRGEFNAQQQQQQNYGGQWSPYNQ